MQSLVIYAIKFVAIVVPTVVTVGDLTHEICSCPQHASDWHVYPDTAEGPPDFFWERRVSVHEMLSCDHGIHFFVLVKQDGQKRRACLTLRRPDFESRAPDFAEAEEISDSLILSIVEQTDAAIAQYETMLLEISTAIDRQVLRNKTLHFDGGWFRKLPQLDVEPPLHFVWRDTNVVLVGSIDVYFLRDG